MASKSMAPLILGGGALLLLASGGKKKKKSEPIVDEEIVEEEQEEEEIDPPTTGGGSSKPKRKDPPSQGSGPYGPYDHDFFAEPSDVKMAFGALGYPVPEDRELMNDPGPDGSLGGGDDVPNVNAVLKFQKQWNQYVEKTGRNDLGELKEDGYVGPNTLNALQITLTELTKLEKSKNWYSVV